MRKRLRKKLKLKEFTDYGFPISIRLKERQPDLNFPYELIDFCYENKMCTGGGGGYDILNYYVTGDKRIWYRSEAITGWLALNNWLENHPKVAEYKLGEIEDANGSEVWDNFATNRLNKVKQT